MLKTYDGVSLWCNYSRQLYRVIMWLKKKYLPSKKSFNVETINFTEKKKRIEVALLGFCHPAREQLEWQSQVPSSFLF